MAKGSIEEEVPFEKILQEVAGVFDEIQVEEVINDLVEEGAEEYTPYDLVTMIEDDGVDEPLYALAGIGTLRRWLETEEEDFVIKALAEGRSWGQIAKMLQRSKQAVWQKHRTPEDRNPD